MGDFLTRPITEKNPSDGKNEKMKFGACSMPKSDVESPQRAPHHRVIGGEQQLQGSSKVVRRPLRRPGISLGACFDSSWPRTSGRR